ncbi:hypothetical protein EYF80_062371 [Liparis tanakae]|uniref:Uncharacterized protein n=1 Tax=Liparis tanakae TaxID=230148 RepID=A0A4Z2EFJ4_9TELE|nr:hypothetical protein EYF80_062371 [Liparis tanakae]
MPDLYLGPAVDDGAEYEGALHLPLPSFHVTLQPAPYVQPLHSPIHHSLPPQTLAPPQLRPSPR